MRNDWAWQADGMGEVYRTPPTFRRSLVAIGALVQCVTY
jgi:hypothetical protein